MENAVDWGLSPSAQFVHHAAVRSPNGIARSSGLWRLV